jgi:hypothetical protein
MADAELIEQLRRALPQLLREHPEVRHELWGLMLEAFPSRQEFLAFLDELRALREESNRRFEGLQREIAQRFEAVDQRFETLLREMNQRFEAVDRRFEAVDRRFETLLREMNQRFEAVDQRFEMQLREMNQRFEAVDRRFEAVDRRFETLLREMNQRFEAVDQRFEMQLREMNQRFEAVDQRFEMQLREMNQRFEAVDRRFEGVIAELREQRLHLSALGARVGRGLEFVVKGIVEEFAGESFPLADRLVLVDTEGEVFGVPGAEVEFDLYAHNGRAYLVEVKSHLKTDDVLKFQRKAVFAEAKLERPLTRLIIALSMDSKAESLMQRLGIEYQVRATLE